MCVCKRERQTERERETERCGDRVPKNKTKRERERPGRIGDEKTERKFVCLFLRGRRRKKAINKH